MIRHVVMFKFKDSAEGKNKLENMQLAKEKIEALLGKVDVLRAMEVGLNDSKASESNYDLVLISDFNSIDDLDKYQIHQEHVKVIDFMKKVIETRSCVDYKI